MPEPWAPLVVFLAIEIPPVFVYDGRAVGRTKFTALIAVLGVPAPGAVFLFLLTTSAMCHDLFVPGIAYGIPKLCNQQFQFFVVKLIYLFRIFIIGDFMVTWGQFIFIGRICQIVKSCLGAIILIAVATQ